MRILRADLLRQFARAPLNEVAVLDLRRCGVAQCGTDLGECAALEVLLLSENLLEDLRGVEACQGRLWKLDARRNKICDLSAFAAFEHVGEVDLGENRLGYGELVKLAHVNIMSLRLDGNAQLVGGGGAALAEQAKRRRNLVYLLPLVWVLDGIVVTSRERAVSNAYFAAAAEAGSEDDLVSNLLALRKTVGARRPVAGDNVLVPRVSADAGGDGDGDGDGDAGTGTGEGSTSAAEADAPENNATAPAAAARVPSIFAWGSSQLALLGGVSSDALAQNHAKMTQGLTTQSKEVQRWEWARPPEIPSDVPACHVFRDWVLKSPILPRLHDRYRVPHIIALHNRCGTMLSKYFEVNTPRVGLSVIDQGTFDIDKLLGLASRTRLDLAIMLAVSVSFDVPQTILQDALSILLKMDLEDRDVDSLGRLPTYCRALLCLAIRSVAMDEVAFSAELIRGEQEGEDGDDDEDEGETQGGVGGYSEIERDLLRSLAPSLHAPVDVQFDIPRENDNVMSLELQARHAIILLSRSPAFPPLLQKKELSAAGVRASYNRLLPLLLVGGMAATDLEADSDGANMWRQAVRNPARQYDKPWAEGSGDQHPGGAGASRGGGGDSSGRGEGAGGGGGGETDGYPEKQGDLLGGYPQQDMFYSMPPSASAPAPGIRLEDEPSASATFYKASRLPNVGECVEISFNDGNRYFPKIVGLTKQNNMVQLEPLNHYMRQHHHRALADGGESSKEIWLSVRELFWNPNGYWKHSSAASAGAQRMRLITQMRSSKLHRSSSGLSRSGLSLSRGLSNAALIPASTDAAGMGEEGKQPRMVGGFAADGTWDAHFVLAPPKLVHAQNVAAGPSGGWNVVGEHDFTLNAGPLKDVLAVEAATPLGVPPQSPVFRLLQAQLEHNESRKQQRALTAAAQRPPLSATATSDRGEPKSIDQDASSSLFQLTSLPPDEQKGKKTEGIRGGEKKKEQEGEQKVKQKEQEKHPEVSDPQAGGGAAAATAAAAAAAAALAKPPTQLPSPKTRARHSSMQRSNTVPMLRPRPRVLAPPGGFGSFEEQVLRLAPVAKKKKASGPTEWYVKQGKSTMVVDQFNYARAWSDQQKKILSGRSLEADEVPSSGKKGTKMIASERSRLVQRVALLRKRASRTRFSTIEAEADKTIRLSIEKGKSQLGKLNAVPHEFMPVNEAIPTPLLPNKALKHGVKAKARQHRVNRYKRSLGEIRREKRLVVAGKMSTQGRRDTRPREPGNHAAHSTV
jgi:hypothetical protein